MDEFNSHKKSATMLPIAIPNGKEMTSHLNKYLKIEYCSD
jgi:hypothetical protein